MTSVCNVFRPLTSETGNFLLFSQYVEDLSRSTVDTSTYKVSPSRFVCLNLNSSDIKNSRLYLDDIITPAAHFWDEPNSFMSQYWQDAFENSVSCMRNQNTNFVNHNFATTFWWHLANICRDSLTDSFKLQNKIVYVGNIDLVGWEDGFADVILNINSGSGPNIVTINTNLDTERDWSNFTKFTNDCTLPSGKSYVQGSNAPSDHPFNGTIEGWDYDDFPSSTIVNGVVSKQNVTVGAGKIGNDESKVDDGSNSIFNNMFNVAADNTHTSFSFNTIVVLYDVYEGNSTSPSYTDIPMGVFFTGLITAENQGGGNFSYEIQNPVTIYKSSDDAYGAGTGWSLRICTRFSATPEGYLKVEEVATESGAIYDVISAQLSAVAELIKSNRVGLNENVKISQDLKNAINDFTSLQKTNIPYIGSDGYWYVNGTNTGQSAVAADAECSDADILSILN